MTNNSHSLDGLINSCTTASGNKWEAAWAEFLRIYKKDMCFFIDNSCSKWDVSVLRISKEDLMDEVLSLVLIILNENLHTYQNRDSKAKFRAWLQVVCNRATIKQIHNIYRNYISNPHITEFGSIKDSNNIHSSEELYDSFVYNLRKSIKGMVHSERNIHIFLLNVWSGYKIKNIVELPFFGGMKFNTIEIIIHKVRKKINGIKSY